MLPGAADPPARVRMQCYRPGPRGRMVGPAPAGPPLWPCAFREPEQPGQGVPEEALALWSRGSWRPCPVREACCSAAGSRSRRAEERLRDALARRNVAAERAAPGRTDGDPVGVPQRPSTTTWTSASIRSYVQRPDDHLRRTLDGSAGGRPSAGLAGASRQGVRVLRAAGLHELLAETPDDYVRIATVLAGDLPRMAALRSSLRERLSRSPLMDSRRLTRDLEAAYRDLWEGWADGTNHPPAGAR